MMYCYFMYVDICRLVTELLFLISPLIGALISLTGLLFDLKMTSAKNLLLQTNLNQTIIALNPTSTF